MLLSHNAQDGPHSQEFSVLKCLGFEVGKPYPGILADTSLHF